MACSRRIFNIRQTPDSIDVYIYPDSDICTDFDRFGDTPNFACVDEDKDAPDDDLTYVYSASPTELTDLYGLPDQNLAGTINYVQVYARAKSHLYSQHEDGIYKILLNADGQCTDGGIAKSSDIDIITGYTTYVNTWIINPETLVAFSWADIDAMAIGVECNSLQVTGAAKTSIFRPNAVGTRTEHNDFPAAGNNYEKVDETIPDDDTTFIYYSDVATVTDTYHIPNHTTETGVIDSITVYFRIRCTHSGVIKNYRVQPVLDVAGTEAYGTYKLTSASWENHSETWTSQPSDGSPWTWAVIDNLQIGVGTDYDGGTGTNSGRTTQVYLIVNYRENTNPEIRTTQCYARVNYTPGEIICSLNKPNQISTNHSRNIQMLNFWSGNRAVYDLNRSGKSMVLTGTEWEDATITDACARVECVRQLGENGAEVRVTGLGSLLWDGTYRIRSFGWKHISECPNVYDWILELEDVRYCSECGNDTYFSPP